MLVIVWGLYLYEQITIVSYCMGCASVREDTSVSCCMDCASVRSY